jgi:hypothetical protein
MPTMTYEPIETQTLDSAAASVTFFHPSTLYRFSISGTNAANRRSIKLTYPFNGDGVLITQTRVFMGMVLAVQ